MHAVVISLMEVWLYRRFGRGTMVPVHSTKANGILLVEVHSIANSALDGGWWWVHVPITQTSGSVRGISDVVAQIRRAASNSVRVLKNSS
jgi:hypothetical protein